MLIFRVEQRTYTLAICSRGQTIKHSWNRRFGSLACSLRDGRREVIMFYRFLPVGKFKELRLRQKREANDYVFFVDSVSFAYGVPRAIINSMYSMWCALYYLFYYCYYDCVLNVYFSPFPSPPPCLLQTPKCSTRRTTTSTDGCPYPPEVTFPRITGLRCTSASGTRARQEHLIHIIYNIFIIIYAYVRLYDGLHS